MRLLKQFFKQMKHDVVKVVMTAARPLGYIAGGGAWLLFAGYVGAQVENAGHDGFVAALVLIAVAFIPPGLLYWMHKLYHRAKAAVKEENDRLLATLAGADESGRFTNYDEWLRHHKASLTRQQRIDNLKHFEKNKGYKI